MGNSKYRYYKYNKLRKYNTILEDNKNLKENLDIAESLYKHELLRLELEILSYHDDIESVQELIDIYSNEQHELIYYEKTHSLLIRGSMRVDVFHKFILDSRKFNFTNITLEG